MTRMRRGVGSKDRKTTPATNSTAPVRQLLGSANAETTQSGTQATAAVRMQKRPDAAREGKNQSLSRAAKRNSNPTECHTGGGGARRVMAVRQTRPC